MKKGDIVRSSGKGKTKSWGHYIGTITKVNKDNIFVIWDGKTFEDQMNIEEVELLLGKSRNVTKLEFSDGMIIHIGGELRTLELSDGWYVVGEGKLIPVKSEEEGNKIISQLKDNTL
jgi:hypothetical protein